MKKRPATMAERLVRVLERLLEGFALAMCRVFSVTPDQIERHRDRHRERPGPRRPRGAFEA